MSAARILNVEPGSAEHFKLRLGRVTASNAYDLLPAKRGGGYKQARQTYMNELIGEICTGEHQEINARPLEWGKTNEVAARGAYQLITRLPVEPIGMVTTPDGRASCSPDIKIIGQARFGEIKCPWATVNHINFILDGEVKEEWITQIQFSLWVTKAEIWDFASFDPRMKQKIIDIKTFEKDMRLMSIFDQEVPQFVFELDKKLAQIGIPFGNQWL